MLIGATIYSHDLMFPLLITDELKVIVWQSCGAQTAFGFQRCFACVHVCVCLCVCVCECAPLLSQMSVQLYCGRAVVHKLCLVFKDVLRVCMSVCVCVCVCVSV